MEESSEVYLVSFCFPNILGFVGRPREAIGSSRSGSHGGSGDKALMPVKVHSGKAEAWHDRRSRWARWEVHPRTAPSLRTRPSWLHFVRIADLPIWISRVSYPCTPHLTYFVYLFYNYIFFLQFLSIRTSALECSRRDLEWSRKSLTYVVESTSSWRYRAVFPL